MKQKESCEQFMKAINRRSFVKLGGLAGLGGLAAATLGSTRSLAAAPAQKDPLKVAVITGGHLFDVPNFHLLFRSWPEVDAYIQPMLDFASSPLQVRDSYDVVLFYIMLMDALEKDDLGPQLKKAKNAIEHLRETGQGLVVMHHAILAYPGWQTWTDLTGLPNRKFTFDHDQKMKLQVAAPDHPILRGIQSWEMVDETYGMMDAGEGNRILLTTDHPKSMKTIAWTRQFGKSNVFCIQSGHDNQCWANPNFKEVLRRGIGWSAKHARQKPW
jgi:type 1 glutamine amidotransferase